MQQNVGRGRSTYIQPNIVSEKAKAFQTKLSAFKSLFENDKNIKVEGALDPMMPWYEIKVGLEEGVEIPAGVKPEDTQKTAIFFVTSKDENASAFRKIFKKVNALRSELGEIV